MYKILIHIFLFSLFHLKLSTENCPPELLGGRTRLSLISGCELFVKFVMKIERKTEYNSNITLLKRALRERASSFSQMCKMSRLDIAHRGKSFFKENCTVLIHGCSRVVLELLHEAVKHTVFNIIVTSNSHARDGGDRSLLEMLALKGLSYTLVEDRAVAAVMDQIDFCLVGAEAVSENGGVINQVGSFQIALVASSMKKPFYVVAESYKFAKNFYPLNQRDALESSQSPHKDLDKFSIKQPSVGDHFQSIDYTPPEYISLLFTDLGVITPQAVYEETMKMYEDINEC
jgi:translation initiation factor eIF-2B subunit alpha